ncbi:MAG TPA: LLM class flavin-dependent oxidoreductase [Solirubrobacteraceae bacterium]|jgi:alkanesulfonate monooxygenase SsuD/methylene tetrahydromethanopterin reductase-like flavin-dependent oxidoreductase (luciferase family)
MRLLLAPEGVDSLEGLVQAGRAVSTEGLDGVLIRPSSGLPAPLVSAGVLAGAVDHVLIAVAVPLGDRHPLELAEEAAVVDLGAGGRLILVVEPAAGQEEHFAEALDLVRTALAAGPFRWSGPRWQTPANLPENVNNPERRTRLMPPPLQPRLEIWTGAGAGSAAIARGLGYLAPTDADVAELEVLWRSAAENPATIGAPRARDERWVGARELVERLRAGRSAFGQDWAVVRAPVAAAPELGRYVRPRVVLDELPPGLEEHWDLNSWPQGARA